MELTNGDLLLQIFFCERVISNGSDTSFMEPKTNTPKLDIEITVMVLYWHS